MGARSVGDVLEITNTSIYTIDVESVIDGVEKYQMSKISWTTGPFRLTVTKEIATTAEIDELVSETALRVSTSTTTNLLAPFAAATA